MHMRNVQKWWKKKTLKQQEPSTDLHTFQRIFDPKLKFVSAPGEFLTLKSFCPFIQLEQFRKSCSPSWKSSDQMLSEWTVKQISTLFIPHDIMTLCLLYGIQNLQALHAYQQYWWEKS